MAASPTVKRRRVGLELRKLREAAGLTVTDAARSLDMNASTISRLEAGKFRLKVVTVRAMLDLYNVSDPTYRDGVLDLARTSGQRGWWETYVDTLPSPEVTTYVGLESGASEIRISGSHQMPGLFQTRQYAEALFQSRAERPPEMIERMTELRITRQERLTDDDPLTVKAVIGEAVLLCRLGSAGMMREQLDRLLEVSRSPNVLLQVLPFTSSAYVVYNRPFLILDFDPGDPGVVYMEHSTGALYVDRSDEVTRYRLEFEQLQAAALGPDESRDRIAAAMDRYTEEGYTQ